ncbi:hypothetical protein GQ43DRAFT_493224, partial [Delitschia confertaspora ATCC 74209]
MDIYWWAVALLNVGIMGYGICGYCLVCAYINDLRVFTCNSGAGKPRLVRHSIGQMSLNILGGLLILFIPIRIIWTIRVSWGQKLALICSLCLTIFMIIITIIRVSGLVNDGAIDNTWEVYWLVLGGEV